MDINLVNPQSKIKMPHHCHTHHKDLQIRVLTIQFRTVRLPNLFESGQPRMFFEFWALQGENSWDVHSEHPHSWSPHSSLGGVVFPLIFPLDPSKNGRVCQLFGYDQVQSVSLNAFDIVQTIRYFVDRWLIPSTDSFQNQLHQAASLFFIRFRSRFVRSLFTVETCHPCQNHTWQQSPWLRSQPWWAW